MKKIIAVLTVFSMMFAFAACKKEEKPEVAQTTRNMNQQEVVIHETVTDNSGEIVTEAGGEAVTVTEIHTEIITEPESLAADPAEWSDEEIIAYYKSAAIKTHGSVKSIQTMTMTKMKVNNGDGALGFFVDMAEPIIQKVLEKNSTEIDGITGGFNNLVVSDAKSLKAYKSGEYTVIEMTMKDQTDGKHGDNVSGTVGHAITVLGDVSVAVAEFPQFKIDTDNADITIHYTNPTVKVKINSDGIIEKGTWKYSTDIDIEHLDISGIMVDTADAGIDYVIKLGGGF